MRNFETEMDIEFLLYFSMNYVEGYQRIHTKLHVPALRSVWPHEYKLSWFPMEKDEKHSGDTEGVP